MEALSSLLCIIDGPSTGCGPVCSEMAGHIGEWCSKLAQELVKRQGGQKQPEDLKNNEQVFIQVT